MSSGRAKNEAVYKSIADRRARPVGEGTQMVLELLASGAPVPGVLSLLLRSLSDEIGSPCGLYLLKNNQLRLSAGEVPALPEVLTRGARPHLWRQPQELVLGGDSKSYFSIPVQTETGHLTGILLVQRPAVSRIGRRLEWQAIQTTAQLAALAMQYPALQASRAVKFQTGLDPKTNGIIVCDLNGRIMFYNQAAQALVGSKESLQGRMIDDIALTEVVLGELASVHQQDHAQQSRFQVELDHQLVEGVVSPLSSPTGRPYGVAVFLYGATAEANYRKLQDALIANMSHELHGPLATLSATVEALCDGIIPEAQRKRYVDYMLAELQRLRRMADDLVRLSRLDSGSHRQHLQHLQVASLMRVVTDAWTTRIKHAGIRFHVYGADCTVYADEASVTEVMAHLLSNALQHTPAGGSIKVTATPESDVVWISVTDTGSGIDPKHLPHIWDRFYMADEARTRVPGSGVGVGLGLSLVQSLVRRMGGEVSAVSTPGIGSVISFSLPRSRR